MAKKQKQGKLDVYDLREDLMKLAEKEAKKKPDISKEELKKKLTDYVTKSKVAEAALTPGTKHIVEMIIGICAEFAVKTLELYLREKNERGKSPDKANPAGKDKEKEPAVKKLILKKKPAAKKTAKKK